MNSWLKWNVDWGCLFCEFAPKSYDFAPKNSPLKVHDFAPKNTQKCKSAPILYMISPLICLRITIRFEEVDEQSDIFNKVDGIRGDANSAAQLTSVPSSDTYKIQFSNLIKGITIFLEEIRFHPQISNFL